MNHSFIR